MTVPFWIDDTVPRPILTAWLLPTLMCAFLAAARVIVTVAIPLAARFELTRTTMPLRSTAFRLCGRSCRCTWNPPFEPEPEPGPGAGPRTTPAAAQAAPFAPSTWIGLGQRARCCRRGRSPSASRCSCRPCRSCARRSGRWRWCRRRSSTGSWPSGRSAWSRLLEPSNCDHIALVDRARHDELRRRGSTLRRAAEVRDRVELERRGVVGLALQEVRVLRAAAERDLCPDRMADRDAARVVFDLRAIEPSPTVQAGVRRSRRSPPG